MTWNHVPPLPSFLAVAWRASSLNFGYIHRERFAVVVTGLRFNCHSPSSILYLSLSISISLSFTRSHALSPSSLAMFVPRASRSGRRIVSLSFEIKFAASPRVILRKISLYGVIKSPIWNVVVVVLGIILWYYRLVAIIFVRLYLLLYHFFFFSPFLFLEGIIKWSVHCKFNCKL